MMAYVIKIVAINVEIHVKTLTENVMNAQIPKEI